MVSDNLCEDGANGLGCRLGFLLDSDFTSRNSPNKVNFSSFTKTETLAKSRNNDSIIRVLQGEWSERFRFITHSIGGSTVGVALEEFRGVKTERALSIFTNLSEAGAAYVDIAATQPYADCPIEEYRLPIDTTKELLEARAVICQMTIELVNSVDGPLAFERALQTAECS